MGSGEKQPLGGQSTTLTLATRDGTRATRHHGFGGSTTTEVVSPGGHTGRYAVGVRVFKDKRLLRQIRHDIIRNVLQPEQIAPLENVTPEVLVALLEDRLADDADSAAHLREFAASKPGFRTAAWLTTRHHPSKLHVLNDAGVALCGTPLGAERAALHSGPCHTCAAQARADAHPTAPSPRHAQPRLNDVNADAIA